MIKNMNQQKKDNELFAAHGVYLIYVNGVVKYVGSSLDFMKRKSGHLGRLRHHNHSNDFLQQLYDIHGEESFIFQAVPETTMAHPSTLYEYEAKYIYLHRNTVVNIANVNPDTTKLIRKGAAKKKNAEELSERFSGEKNPGCKITEIEALEIIKLKKDKIMIQIDIAAKYGISIGQVSKIGRTKWLNLI